MPSGILAFEGEDKAAEADRNVARNEPLSELNCFIDTFFGNVPCQLCCNTGGVKLEFVAIHRNPCGRPTMHSLAPVVDLSTVRGRSLCVRCAVNIARILVALQVISFGQKTTTSNSSVNVMGDFAIKKEKAHSGSVLTELHAQIQWSHPPSLASSLKEVKITRGNLLTAHAIPVGFCGK